MAHEDIEAKMITSNSSFNKKSEGNYVQENYEEDHGFLEKAHNKYSRGD